MRKEEKKEQATKDLINKMFEIAGHDLTFEDIKKIDREDDPWYMQYSMTEEQNQSWRDWGVQYLREKLKTKKALAIRDMAFFDLVYGLTIKKENHE
jgi:hypothetical protein